MCYTISVKGRGTSSLERGSGSNGRCPVLSAPKAPPGFPFIGRTSGFLSYAFPFTGVAPVKCAGGFHIFFLSFMRDAGLGGA